MYDQNDEIDLMQIFYLLSKYKRKLITMALIGTIIGSLIMVVDFSKNRRDPRYVITSSFAVVTTNNSGNYITNTTNPGYNDIILAEDIAKSVVFVTKSDRALSSAIKNMHYLGISADEIKENLSVEQYSDTQIITMKLKWINANEGLDIVQSICSVVPDILIDTLNLGSVSIVDFPKNEGIENIRVHFEYVIIGAILLPALYVAFRFLENIIHPTLSNLNNAEKDLNGVECFGYLPDDEKYFISRPYSLSMEDDMNHYQIKEALISTAHLIRSVILNEGFKCLYFTSSQSGEGKTGIIANVAIELSKQGLKTLVIDMDVRKPTLGSCFMKKVEHNKSLNGVFDGSVETREAICQISDYLYVLPARLERDRVRVDKILTGKLKEVFDDYDIVLLDTAPIGLVSDVVMLNALAERAVMVVRYDTVWIDLINQNIDKLRKSGIETCGFIVANIQNYASGTYNSYQKKYSDTYADYYGLQKKNLPKPYIKEKHSFLKKKNKQEDKN